MELEQEVNNGRFPPCICYKILYTSPEERRVKPYLLTVDLLGADVPLTFSCKLKEEPSECLCLSMQCVCNIIQTIYFLSVHVCIKFVQLNSEVYSFVCMKIQSEGRRFVQGRNRTPIKVVYFQSFNRKWHYTKRPWRQLMGRIRCRTSYS